MSSVFGRIVAWMDHISAIGKLPTDEKDRPLSRVTITHCGELELRKPAAPSSKPPVRSNSPANSVSDKSPQRRPNIGSGSETGTDSEEEERERRRRRKQRKAERRDKKEKKAKAPREETEAELDER